MLLDSCVLPCAKILLIVSTAVGLCRVAVAQERGAIVDVPEASEARAVQERNVAPIVIESAEDATARKAFDELLASKTSLEFISTPLRDILQFLEGQKSIDFEIDQRAFDDLGITADIPVSIDVRNVTLKTALERLLVVLELGYVMLDGNLLITDASFLHCYPAYVLKVYPVADLLRRSEDGSFEYKALTSAITDMIEPDSWLDFGESGVLRPVAGTLVISQTEQVHELIESLLRALRKVGDPQLSPPDEPLDIRAEDVDQRSPPTFETHGFFDLEPRRSDP